VDVKTAQDLLRHSSPVLTLGVYVHSDKARLAAAVQTLPELKPALPETADTEAAEALRTGTDCQPVKLATEAETLRLAQDWFKKTERPSRNAGKARRLVMERRRLFKLATRV
jgi:hypothetical protein